jgi:hypothetical protein
MKRDTGTVRRWAEAIVRQLGASADVTLQVGVVDAGADGDDAGWPWTDPGDAPFASRLRLTSGAPGGPPAVGGDGDDGVTVRLGHEDGSATTVFLSARIPDAQAVAELAGQLQDAVLESTGGAPLPPCPVAGHRHPATAEVLDGTACWTCPSGGAARPVLPGPDAER